MVKADFHYQQHPHAQNRKVARPQLTRGNVEKLSVNDRIGLGITKRVGSMWAAYGFVGLSLVSLPAALSTGDTVIIIAWIAQTFLQLVLLPVIMVGQNLQAHESEKRAIATYEDAGAILEEAKQIQSHLSEQDKALNHLIDRMESLEAKLIKASKN